MKITIVYYKSIFQIIFFTFILLFSDLNKAQENDSLIQIINHSQSVEKINETKKKLPEHLTKIDMNILDVIRQLKAEGTNRSNVLQKEIHKRFSNNALQIDDKGNIRADIYMNQIDSKSINSLRENEVEVEYIDENFKRVTCIIPFDVIINLAKNASLTGIFSIPKTITEIGAYTTAGDGILSASTTRSTYSINGSGIKVGIISDGVDDYTRAQTSGDLPSSFQVINNRIGGNEGTALGEIIYDLAPGVSLAFSDMGSGESGIVSSINALRNQIVI